MQQHIVNSKNVSFGDHVRRKRELLAIGIPLYSLRQLAVRCGVTPAYLSRMERDEVSPPGEETLLKLALELGEDPDVFLALAGKVSADLRAIILSRPKLFADVIRTIKSMPDAAFLKIVREGRDGDW